MLYKFRSKAAGDVIMLGPNGDQVLRIVGRDPSSKGIFEVAKHTLPFFFLMLIGVAIVTVFPAIVTWLPQTMLAR